MPRKTPVREIQTEEVSVSSPLRRSSRLSNNSPIPTKVITRRNSESEAPVSAPKVTRSRRSSLNQETEPSDEAEKRKPTSTIRTRRSSLTQSNDEQKEEPTLRPRTRGSSLTKELPPDLKKTTRRRRSVSEEPEVVEDTAKKTTRTRSGSITKSDSDVAKSSTKKLTSGVRDVLASTPVKKSPSNNSIEASLESIEELEQTSPNDTPVNKFKKKNVETVKMDLDLSVINEASITEEEATPQKKLAGNEEIKNQAESEKEVALDKKDEATTNGPKDSVINPDASKASKDGIVGDKKSDCFDSSMSDVSFNLQLSASHLENETKADNKENVHPNEKSVSKEDECEPMDVDDSVFEISSPAKSKTVKSPKTSDEGKVNEVERKLQAAEQITDEIAQFLSEEVSVNSVQEKSRDKIDLEETEPPVEKKTKDAVKQAGEEKTEDEESNPKSIEKEVEVQSEMEVDALQENQNIPQKKSPKKKEVQSKQNDDSIVCIETGEEIEDSVKSQGLPNSEDKSENESLTKKSPRKSIGKTDDHHITAENENEKSEDTVERSSSTKKSPRKSVGKTDELNVVTSEVEKPENDLEQKKESLRKSIGKTEENHTSVEDKNEKSESFTHTLPPKKQSPRKSVEKIEAKPTAIESKKSEDILDQMQKSPRKSAGKTEDKHATVESEKPEDMVQTASPRRSPRKSIGKTEDKHTTVENKNEKSEIFSRTLSPKKQSPQKTVEKVEEKNTTIESKKSTNILEEMDKSPRKSTGKPEDKHSTTENKSEKPEDTVQPTSPKKSPRKSFGKIEDEHIVSESKKIENILERVSPTKKSPRKSVGKTDEPPLKLAETAKSKETQKSLDFEESFIDVEEDYTEHDKTDVCNISISETRKNEKFVINDENVSLTDDEKHISRKEKSSLDDDLDREVEAINETNESVLEISLGRKECTPPAVEESHVISKEDSYRSPQKKFRQNLNKNNDETAISEKRDKRRSSIIPSRSPEKKCSFTPDKKKTKYYDVNKSIEVIEVDDNDETDEEESVKNVSLVEENKTNGDEISEDTDENLGDSEPEKEVSVLSISSKKRLTDRTSITLQETVKAGDDAEKTLSEKIHKVVDIFCAGIKNKSDVSVNVSLDYTGQGSDNEDENNKTDLVEISFTSSKLNEEEAESHKGSKRRKIYHSSEENLQSPQKSQIIVNKTPKLNQSVEEKVDSAKKVKKRRTSDTELPSADVNIKSSPKVSFSLNNEEEGQSKKKKSRKSLEESSEKNSLVVSPTKKPLHLTPFRVTGRKSEESSDEATEESSNGEDEENDAEEADDTVLSQTEDSKCYVDLFGTSLDENDPNDTTWKQNTDVSSDDSESDAEDVDEEESLSEELNLLEEVTPVVGKRTKRTQEKSVKCEEVEVVAKDVSPDKSKKKKFFRLSKYNVSQAFTSSESDENLQKNQKKAKAKTQIQPSSDVKEKKSKTKKSKQMFFSETKKVQNMLPEASETQKKKGKKRQHSDAKVSDDRCFEKSEEFSEEKKKKKVQMKSKKESKKKPELLSVIKPSSGNTKNKPLLMKPSTRTSLGWDVSML